MKTFATDFNPHRDKKILIPPVRLLCNNLSPKVKPAKSLWRLMVKVLGGIFTRKVFCSLPTIATLLSGIIYLTGEAKSQAKNPFGAKSINTPAGAFLPQDRKTTDPNSIMRIASSANPFSTKMYVRTAPPPTTQQEQQKNYPAVEQRQRIMSILENLSVKGYSLGANPKVLLGDLVCEEGKTLIDVVPEQTQHPYVDKIDFINKKIIVKFVRVPLSEVPYNLQRMAFSIPFKMQEKVARFELSGNDYGGNSESGSQGKQMKSRVRWDFNEVDNRTESQNYQNRRY